MADAVVFFIDFCMDFILYKNLNCFIIYNLVYVCAYNICEERSGDARRRFHG